MLEESEHALKNPSKQIDVLTVQKTNVKKNVSKELPRSNGVQVTKSGRLKS